MLTYLEAGCGFGGSCFVKDVQALIAFAKQNNVAVPMLQSTLDTNTAQPVKLVELAASMVRLQGARVAVLGLAFKPDTDDTRDSPAIPVINQLLREDADVVVYDPIVKQIDVDDEITYGNSWEETITGADAAIIVTRWPVFQEITQEKIEQLMEIPVVIDGRRMLPRGNFKKNSYRGVGLSLKH